MKYITPRERAERLWRLYLGEIADKEGPHWPGTMAIEKAIRAAERAAFKRAKARKP